MLKGPQGALYGRNAIGGAIIIRTKAPTDELEGQVKLGYGNGPGERVQAARERAAGIDPETEIRASGIVLQHRRATSRARSSAANADPVQRSIRAACACYG